MNTIIMSAGNETNQLHLTCWLEMTSVNAASRILCWIVGGSFITTSICLKTLTVNYSYAIIITTTLAKTSESLQWNTTHHTCVKTKWVLQNCAVSNGVFTWLSKRPANVQQFTCILNTLLEVCWIV